MILVTWFWDVPEYVWINLSDYISNNNELFEQRFADNFFNGINDLQGEN